MYLNIPYHLQRPYYPSGSWPIPARKVDEWLAGLHCAVMPLRHNSALPDDESDDSSESDFEEAQAKRRYRQVPLYRHVLDAWPDYRPEPAMLYGYDTATRDLLTPEQQSTLSLHVPGGGHVNHQRSLFPYLVVQFVDDPDKHPRTPISASPDLGAAEDCVLTIDGLNGLLRKAGVRPLKTLECLFPGPDPVEVLMRKASGYPLDNSIWTISIDGCQAKIFVTHIEDDRFSTEDVDTLMYHKPSEYNMLRCWVRDLVEWGLGPRLQAIRKAIDFLAERKRAETEGVETERVEAERAAQ